MGHEIETAALARGHEVIARLDTAGDWDAFSENIRMADAVFEFSLPGTVIANVRRCFDMHLPVIIGTTGWNDRAGEVKKWCLDEGQAVFAASNFSIGVNMLYRITANLAEMINKLEDYQISLEEIHHIHKLDAPSGTAINIAEIILDKVERKKTWVNRPAGSPEELPVISVREGEIPGIHTITCESDTEKLILRHEAKGRKGLALGAVLAAEWLQGKKGYFGMSDMLRFNQ